MEFLFDCYSAYYIKKLRNWLKLTKINSFDENHFDVLNKRISSLTDDKIVRERKNTLIYLFLSHRFYCEKIEIEEAFTDGGNDSGVDAVYIDRRGDQPIVHIFQSKVYESLRKAKNPFKSSSIVKIFRFFEILKDRDVDLAKTVNQQVYQKILEIRDLQDRDFPVFKYWLLSNGMPCVDHEAQPYINQLNSYDIKLFEFHMFDFVEFCINAHSSRQDHTFDAREAGVIEFGNSELRSFVGYISAQQLYYLIKDMRDERKIDYSVFDMNVRGFLGLENAINKEIFKSAASSDNIHFGSLNNGITIVGSVCKVMRTGRDAPKVGVKQMSIVNGAQTCSAIFAAMRDFFPDFKRFERLSVLFRVFETDRPEQINRIAISTNNQNRINPRDLKTNDDAQYRLERELQKHEVLYIRRRGLLPTDIKYSKSLDALLAGQLILSYIHHEPARAKRDSDSIFTTEYTKIFSNVSVEKLLNALEWFELIEEKKAYIQDELRIRGARRTENTFVTYGGFHILMLCALLSENKENIDRIGIIDKSIEIIAEQLKGSGEPAYYSFFRDSKQSENLRISALQMKLL